ncbi:MAG: hypothetical protein KGJ13_00300 [Patescibacteria group bacterium]|nr:hypothetical protein [Patescibacteria group bacterium]
MDLPPQDPPAIVPAPPSPANKPSFFKRRLFNFLILPIILIIALLAITDIITGGEVRFLGEFMYTYVQERNATSAVNLANFSATTTPSFGLQHQTSLADLGIKIPNQPGNGADDYIMYFGYDTPTPIFHHVSGTWDNVYGGSDENKINLGTQDEQFLMTMAAKQNFSFSPEHFPIPKTPISDVPSPFSPANTLRFTRRMIILANTYSSSSNPRRAELLLQALIVWGRKMEEAKDATMIQWLIGEKVEESAVPALISFYDGHGNISQKDVFLKYQQEITAIKQNANKFSSLDIAFTSANAALASLKNPQLNDSAFVKTTIESFMTTDDYNFMLNAINTDEPILQSDALHGGLMLLRINGPEPEHSIAMQILQRYQHSESPLVRAWASYALNTDPNQIIQDIQTAASSSPL